MTFDPKRLIFIHGLEGSSQGAKATLLGKLFPGALIPDFGGPLEARMAQLEPLLAGQTGWTLVGSSFGGLMGALYTCQHPDRVRKLVLMAPALVGPDFAEASLTPVETPTVIYHGSRDEVIPLAPVQQIAGQVFLTLTFHTVDDDHRLYKTAHAIDWKALLED